MQQLTPYELLGGDAGVRRLSEAFYDAMDELTDAQNIRAMHAENLDTIKEKLYEYLSGWLGGPGLYAEKTGTVCLTDPHNPYAIGPSERDQWLLCFTKALEKIEASDELKQMLEDPIYRVAEAVRNCDDSSKTNRGKDGVIAVG